MSFYSSPLQYYPLVSHLSRILSINFRTAYLFGNTNNDEGKSKFYQILATLKELYAYKDEEAGRDYSDYDLYVTGHSLGGALAQLLAFTLAGSKDSDFLPKPVTAISYASPQVGKSGYLRAFEKLEKDGKLRHIRVSNEGDVVPVAPSKLLGFKQVSDCTPDFIISIPLGLFSNLSVVRSHAYIQ